jgi:hypothetical protein
MKRSNAAESFIGLALIIAGIVYGFAKGNWTIIIVLSFFLIAGIPEIISQIRRITERRINSRMDNKDGK